MAFHHPHQFLCVTLLSSRTQTIASTNITKAWKRENKQEFFQTHTAMTPHIRHNRVNLALLMGTNQLLVTDIALSKILKDSCMFLAVTDISCHSMTYTWLSSNERHYEADELENDHRQQLEQRSIKAEMDGKQDKTRDRLLIQNYKRDQPTLLSKLSATRLIPLENFCRDTELRGLFAKVPIKRSCLEKRETLKKLQRAAKQVVEVSETKRESADDRTVKFHVLDSSIGFVLVGTFCCHASALSFQSIWKLHWFLVFLIFVSIAIGSILLFKCSVFLFPE